MKHILICSLLVGSFFTITAMNHVQKPSCIWIKTRDKQIINVDKAIIQQSNLLTVLQDIYKGTEQQPLMAPITKTELELFCNSVTQPAETLGTNLTDKHYSELMDIAEKLKAQFFYAELAEQLLQVKELYNRLALACLNLTPLKKIIYKKCLKKKSITLYQDNTKTKITGLKFCHDGSYFAETTATGQNRFVTHLRQTHNFFPFATLNEASDVIFSPDDTFMILCNEKRYNDYCLYNPSSSSKTPFSNPTDKHAFPEINPNSNAIITGNKLHIIDNEYKITTTDISDNENCKAVFHPSLPLIISAEKNENEETKITVHDLKGSTKKLVGTYQTNSYIGSAITFIKLHSDGSLLVIDNNIMLNIENPYNPIILQQHTKPYSGINFITPHITFIDDSTKFPCRFFLLNKKGETILSDDEIVKYPIADPTDNYIALLCKNNSNNESTIKIYKTSDLNKNTQPVVIKDPFNITDIDFVNDQLLLTQSYTTKLWDMEGDEVFNLGRVAHYAVHPQTHSIIASRNLNYDIPLDYHINNSISISAPTKLYHYTLNASKVNQKIKTIRESLTLSQALLLNNYCATKVKKQKKLYPNLPDGRAFASLPEKHTFLAQNLALRKTNYLPYQIKDI